MADIVKRQWLINSNNEKIAPYTTTSQVLEDGTGKGLDIILNEIKGQTGSRLNFENTYFLSQEVQNNETEETALRRLLGQTSFKVIVLDSSIEISSPLEISSNTYLIGAHKGVAIYTRETISTLLTFLTTTIDNQETLSNIYVSNLSLRNSTSNSSSTIIKIGGKGSGFIQCNNCTFENLVFNENENYLRVSGLMMNNIKSQDTFWLIHGDNNHFTNSTLFGGKGFELSGDNNILINCIFKNISSDDSYIYFEGNNNIYDNISCIENITDEKIEMSGSNNIFKGKFINNTDINGKDNNENYDFYLSEGGNNIVTLQCIPGGNKYAIKEDESSFNNQFYVTTPDETYNNGYNIFKDKWVASDYENAVPLILDTANYSFDEETQKIRELGNGQYLINGDFEEITLKFSNLITRTSEGRTEFYPISCKNITPLSNNNTIYINCENSSSPSNSFEINLNEKHLNIFVDGYNISVYLNGTFNNEIFSFQQILSTSNNKVHIGG